MSVTRRIIVILLLGCSAAAFFSPLPPLPPISTTMPVPGLTSVLFASRPTGAQVNLVHRLKLEGVIKHQQVVDVMNQVDRQNYVEFGASAYYDSPMGIECGQTISAPHMHGFALETMYPFLTKSSPRETLKMLDVGCGSGYLTAAMGRWVHPKSDKDPRILPKAGEVYGMDIYSRLVDLTRENIKKQDKDLLDSGTVQLKVGNGWEGWPEAGPFDVIHVGAAADGFPTTLANQLAVGGAMVIPMGPTGGFQSFYCVERVAETGNVDTDFKTTRLLDVRYVPLIHELNE